MMLMFHAAPRINGQCRSVSHTNRSLTFSWQAAKSATRYNLTGRSLSQSTNTPSITVNDLTPGSFYSFTVWAVGPGGPSNRITCSDSTGLQSFFALFMSYA